jgi:hypothetical protein
MEIMIGSERNELPSRSIRWKISMSIPLYGFLEGDTVGLLVVAEEGQTILDVARKLQDAASIRVARRENIHLFYQGKAIDPGLTVSQAGLQPLDRFDVIWSRRP